MSSENYVGIIMAENLRFLGEGSSAQGKPGAKARPRGVVDGKLVNIPILQCNAMRGRRRLSQPGVGCAGGRL